VGGATRILAGLNGAQSRLEYLEIKDKAKQKEGSDPINVVS